jgi:hypothetical protein
MLAFAANVSGRKVDLTGVGDDGVLAAGLTWMGPDGCAQPPC